MAKAMFVIPSLAAILLVSVAILAIQGTPASEPATIVQAKFDKVHDRDWAETAEQIQEHENFVRFIAHEIQDNYTCLLYTSDAADE